SRGARRTDTSGCAIASRPARAPARRMRPIRSLLSGNLGGAAGRAQDRYYLTGVAMSTNSLPPAGPARARSQSLVEPRQATVATGQGQDVTEWYRKRYRGVVAAEKRGGEVLLLLDEGACYGVNRLILAFADTEREVLVRSWVDHVPKARIDP